MTSLGDGSGAVICQWCDGDGEANNPLNADPTVALLDWHPPVLCPRCIGTGRDPDGTPHTPISVRQVVDAFAESFGDTCCGKCPGSTCYVDQVTGA